MRETYGIQQAEVRLGMGRPKPVNCLVGSGRFAHWYAPFVHRDIVGEIAKLRGADESTIVRFGSTYGEMGFDFISDPVEALARFEAKNQLFVGDPLPWLRAHAAGVWFCLEVTDALAGQRPGRRLRALLDEFDGTVYGDDAALLRFRADSYSTRDLAPEDAARLVRRQIVNGNLAGIFRYVDFDTTTHQERSYFWCQALIHVVYWHLADMIVGGTVKRCKAEHCGGIFIQVDPRQDYCPKQWRQRESACAMRQRQQKHRKKGV